MTSCTCLGDCDCYKTKSSLHLLWNSFGNVSGMKVRTHRIWATPTDRRHGKSKLKFLLLLYKVYFTRDAVYNYYGFTHFCLCFRRVYFCVQRKKKNVKNMSASLSEMWSEGSYCLVHKRRAHATKMQECRWTNI